MPSKALFYHKGKKASAEGQESSLTLFMDICLPQFVLYRTLQHFSVLYSLVCHLELYLTKLHYYVLYRTT